MRIHRNAETTPAARMTLVHRVLREDWTYAETAAAFAVSERTVAKWVRRFRAGGRAAVEDGSSRPGPAPHQTPARVVPRIRQLRVQQGIAGLGHRPRGAAAAVHGERLAAAVGHQPRAGPAPGARAPIRVAPAR